MTPIRWLFTVTLISVAMLQPIAAQAVPVMSPFPLYPGDEAISNIRLAKNDNIFLDYQKGQLVIINQRETFRLDLSNNVAARIQADITRQENGLWRYHYTVTNTSRSRAPVAIWYLEAPWPEPVNPRILGDVAGPRLLITDIFTWRGGEKTLRWSRTNGGPAVPTGESRDDFQLDTDLKPGFVTAYFQSRPPVLIPENLSSEAQERLQLLNDLDFNSYRVLTLGPRFGKESGLREIAANFHIGINHLISIRWLKETSYFVEHCQEYLQNQVDNWNLDQLGTAPDFKAIPENDLEESIYQALRIALDLPETQD